MAGDYVNRVTGIYGSVVRADNRINDSSVVIMAQQKKMGWVWSTRARGREVCCFEAGHTQGRTMVTCSCSSTFSLFVSSTKNCQPHCVHCVPAVVSYIVPRHQRALTAIRNGSGSEVHPYSVLDIRSYLNSSSNAVERTTAATRHTTQQHTQMKI